VPYTVYRFNYLEEERAVMCLHTSSFPLRQRQISLLPHFSDCCLLVAACQEADLTNPVAGNAALVADKDQQVLLLLDLCKCLRWRCYVRCERVPFANDCNSPCVVRSGWQLRCGTERESAVQRCCCCPIFYVGMRRDCTS
jgi:hypothetical protein